MTIAVNQTTPADATPAPVPDANPIATVPVSPASPTSPVLPSSGNTPPRVSANQRGMPKKTKVLIALLVTAGVLLLAGTAVMLLEKDAPSEDAPLISAPPVAPRPVPAPVTPPPAPEPPPTPETLSLVTPPHVDPEPGVTPQAPEPTAPRVVKRVRSSPAVGEGGYTTPAAIARVEVADYIAGSPVTITGNDLPLRGSVTIGKKSAETLTTGVAAWSVRLPELPAGVHPVVITYVTPQGHKVRATSTLAVPNNARQLAFGVSDLVVDGTVSVILQNLSDNTLAIPTPTITGRYQWDSTHCGISLSPGDSCLVRITGFGGRGSIVLGNMAKLSLQGSAD